jgi:hypothetical protein
VLVGVDATVVVDVALVVDDAAVEVDAAVVADGLPLLSLLLHAPAGAPFLLIPATRNAAWSRACSPAEAFL